MILKPLKSLIQTTIAHFSEDKSFDALRISKDPLWQVQQKILHQTEISTNASATWVVSLIKND